MNPLRNMKGILTNKRKRLLNASPFLGAASIGTVAAWSFLKYFGPSLFGVDYLSSGDLELLKQSADYFQSFQGMAQESAAYASQTLETLHESGTLDKFKMDGLEQQLVEAADITNSNDTRIHNLYIQNLGGDIEEIINDRNRDRVGDLMLGGVASATGILMASVGYFSTRGKKTQQTATYSSPTT